MFEREDDEVLDKLFRDSYFAGEIEFGEFDETPSEFEALVLSLHGKEFGLSNGLREGTCLVLLADEPTISSLEEVDHPKVYMDPRINMEYLQRIDGVVLYDTQSFDDHYAFLAETVAKDIGSCVLVVKLSDVMDVQMQEKFISEGKHYSIALPVIEPVKVLPSYNDPERWKS